MEKQRKLGIIMKRFYTNRDLIKDRYGRMFRLPLELKRRGWEVEVFCPDFVNQETFFEEIEGMRFHSISAKLGGNWMSETPWRKFEADLWLASGQLFAARQAMHVAREQGVPWVLDCYDFYPAFFPKPLRGVAEWWGRRLLRNCNGVIGASRALVEWAREENSNTICIGNGVDRSVFRPLEKSAMRARHGFGGQERWVGYFGSLDEDRGLRETVAAMRLLREEDAAVRLVCAGRCSDPALLKSVDAIWLGMLDQCDLVEVMCACDCALAPYSGGDQIAFSNSCRISEYMACEVAVVATRTGDFERLLPEGHRGLAKAGDPVDLARAIRRQLDEPEVVCLSKDMDWAVLGEQLDSFLKRVR